MSHKSKENINNSYGQLKKNNTVACDICDKIFNNRFDCIVHNASHIIIPLLKQSNFIFCNECQAIFTSQDDLTAHFHNQHFEKVSIKQEINENNDEIDLNKVKDEPIDEIDTFPAEPMRNRLKFEEENLICNGILKDFVTECKVNVQISDKWGELVEPYTESILEHSFEGSIRGLEKKSFVDKLVLDETFTDEYSLDNFAIESVESDNLKSKSVHYDELMKPGWFNCKYCVSFFSNRFSLIQHEIVHLKISKARPLLCVYCDKYIAGNYHNLHKHVEVKHSNSYKNKEYTLKLCKKCGLKYRKYPRHARNYHLRRNTVNVINESTVNDRITVNERNVVNERNGNDSFKKTKSVCDLCVDRIKHKCSQRYIIKGTLGSVEGNKLPCTICGNRFVELKIVEKIRKNCRRAKKISNEDRLKIIQRRFQRLNLLSKV